MTKSIYAGMAHGLVEELKTIRVPAFVQTTDDTDWACVHIDGVCATSMTIILHKDQFICGFYGRSIYGRNLIGTGYESCIALCSIDMAGPTSVQQLKKWVSQVIESFLYIVPTREAHHLYDMLNDVAFQRTPATVSYGKPPII